MVIYTMLRVWSIESVYLTNTADGTLVFCVVSSACKCKTWGAACELSAPFCSTISIRYSDVIMMGIDVEIYRQDWSLFRRLSLPAMHQKKGKKIKNNRNRKDLSHLQEITARFKFIVNILILYVGLRNKNSHCLLKQQS